MKFEIISLIILQNGNWFPLCLFFYLRVWDNEVGIFAFFHTLILMKFITLFWKSILFKKKNSNTAMLYFHEDYGGQMECSFLLSLEVDWNSVSAVWIMHLSELF